MTEHEAANVERYFDEMADGYDARIQELGWVVGGTLADALVAYPGTYHSVVDLGAGTGGTISVIKEHVKPLPAEITAVDVSQGMLDRLVAKHGADSGVHPVRMPITAFLEDARAQGRKFDLGTAIAVLGFMPAEEGRNAIGMMADCLNPGGRFIFTFDPIITHHPVQDGRYTWSADMGHYRQRPDELLGTLQDGGLHVREFELLCPRPIPQPEELAHYISGFVVAEKPITG